MCDMVKVYFNGIVPSSHSGSQDSFVYLLLDYGVFSHTLNYWRRFKYVLEGDSRKKQKCRYVKNLSKKKFI
jgi:hypothetical protein